LIPAGRPRRLAAQFLARRRFTAALGCSVLLHLLALSLLRMPPPAASAPAGSPLNLLLIPMPRWNPTPPQELPQAAPAPAPQPIGRILGGAPQEPQGGPRAPEAPQRRGHSVSAGPITAPANLPSQLRNADAYLDPSRLTRYPQLAAPFAAQYPRRALEEGRRTRVVVQLMIDERGRVAEALLVTGDPSSDFAVAALAALREARFTPAEAGGRPVKARAYFAVSFVLE
jgi:protein TonB